MIKVRLLEESDIASVLKIKLKEEQVKFSATAEDFLASGNKTQHLHVIEYQSKIIGFFRLDIACPSSYKFCPDNALVLRKLAIDINHQGRGLGTQAAKTVLPYVSGKYPWITSLYLTVNTKNVNAKACYLKADYKDTGEQYLGGEFGPQDIMFAKVH